MNLLCGLLGWTKDSKWKRLIKNVQSRVKILNNKRKSIIRTSREDVVQLLKNGEEQRAFIRVDKLSKDQNIVEAYDLLGGFCEFVLIKLPYIRQYNSDCPNDINQAAATLLYASARCGDLPELIELRKLFRKSYGEIFVKRAIELLPGNLVNGKVIEKLAVMSISNEVKVNLMKEIASENNSFQLSERNTTVYHDDDLEEFKVQSRVQEDTKDKDDQRRLFMFKSIFTPPQGDNRANLSDRNTAQKRKSPRIRLKRRQNQIDNQMCIGSTLVSFSIKDMESEMYYKKKLNRRVSSKTGHRIQVKKSSECSSFNCDVEDHYSFVTSEESEDIDDDSACPTPKSSVYHESHKPHPKLPDCDNLEAKFTALKEEYTYSMIRTNFFQNSHLSYLTSVCA